MLMNALVETVVDMPMDFTVIATSPKDMEASQRSLILWAARKIQIIKGEIAEASKQFTIASERKWNSSAWRKEITKHERRAEFYRKIKMALEAGYYIVPPFPVDVFAIRTNKALPKRMDNESRDNHDQLPQVLPAGEGRYVDPKPARDSYSATEMRTVNYQTGEKKQTLVRYHYATEFEDVDFPFKLARAEIREATIRAMGMKLFDTMGVLPRVRKPDPVVCGQIYLPNKTLYNNYVHNEAINFFVAWWLDTATIKV